MTQEGREGDQTDDEASSEQAEREAAFQEVVSKPSGSSYAAAMAAMVQDKAWPIGGAAASWVMESAALKSLWDEASAGSAPWWSNALGMSDAWRSASALSSLGIASYGDFGFADIVSPLTSLELTRAFASGVFNTRSRARDFADVKETPASYSSRLTTPGDYFADTERVISSMDDLNSAIRTLTDKAQAVPLVWRGQQNADWALHSSLFRALMVRQGVKPPEKKPKGPQPYPSEEDLADAETAILRVARESWRYQDASALELFARLQHQGAPTRLLDVTRNPYIAAWFAVEASDEHDEADARLFSLATASMPRSGTVSPETAVLGAQASLREPFWHAFPTPEGRQKIDWGTGAKRRIWVPPEYDPRISAQNAAFVVDGVPMTSSATGKLFKTKDGHYWTRADLLASSSIFARMYSPTRIPRSNAVGLAPTFSFRIKASAKHEIRQMLERWFSYSRATIYPDMGGLAQHIKFGLNEILDERPSAGQTDAV